MLKAGIIGFGKMGQIRAHTFEETGLCKISLVYDRNGSIESSYRRAHNYDEFFIENNLDIIILCVPNHLNYSLTIKSLNAGKHVFCEKPPCFTVLEMEKIAHTEFLKKRKVMYGFNHRHHQAIQKMKEVIHSNNYGKVLWMRGRYGKSVDDSYFKSWRARKDQAGGGILFDQGIHMLDLFLHLGGDFDEVKAFVSNLYWKLEGIEDNVFAIMKNKESGMVASLHSTMTQWRHLFSLEIFLEKGYLVLNGLKTSSGTYGKEELTIAKNRSISPAATWEDEEQFIFDIDNSWLSEAFHFLESIKNGKPIQVGSSKDAMKVMKLIDMIYQNERCEAKELHTHLKPYQEKSGETHDQRL